MYDPLSPADYGIGIDDWEPDDPDDGLYACCGYPRGQGHGPQCHTLKDEPKPPTWDVYKAHREHGQPLKRVGSARSIAGAYAVAQAHYEAIRPVFAFVLPLYVAICSDGEIIALVPGARAAEPADINEWPEETY